MATINLTTKTARVAILDAEKVLTQVDRSPNIAWEDLIEYASNNSGISKAMMSAAVYALENEIQQWIFNGHGIQLGQLGTLYISLNAHAKDTEEEAGVEAVRRLSVKFRQSARLRKLLNTTVSMQTVDDAAASAGTDGSTDSSGSTEEDPFG